MADDLSSVEALARLGTRIETLIRLNALDQFYERIVTRLVEQSPQVTGFTRDERNPVAIYGAPDFIGELNGSYATRFKLKSRPEGRSRTTRAEVAFVPILDRSIKVRGNEVYDPPCVAMVLVIIGENLIAKSTRLTLDEADDEKIAAAVGYLNRLVGPVSSINGGRTRL